MTMRARRLIAVLAGAAAIAVPTVASAPASATPASGSLVLIGGNLAENEEILTTIVDLARAHAGGERPTIAIVTAAAAPAKTPGQANNAKLNNAAANGLYYAELFQALGADTYAVPIDGSVDFKKDAYVPANAHSPEVAAAVAAADGVFFGGGDQMRYVRTLMTCTPADAADEAYTDCTDTPVLAAVRSVVDGGGVVAGVSAGLTIQQGPDMVTGGESWQAWRDGATVAAPGERWRSLDTALASCGEVGGAIPRAFCEQEARLLHCDGFWGMVADCPVTRSEYGQ